MTDIMKLADDYAVAQGDARADLGANAGMDEQDPMWVAMKEARAALQSAIDALQGENGQLHASLQSSRVAFEQVCKHRDALQSKLDELAKQEPLTSKQIRAIEVEVATSQLHNHPTDAEAFARAIEAAHGITKGTP